MKSNLFIWIYMQFVWSSYELHIEGLMKFIFYTHVIPMKLTWGSSTFRTKYIWISYEFRMIWTSCELHVNFIRITWQVHKKFLYTTHEYGFWHPCYVLHMNEPPGPSYLMDIVPARPLETRVIWPWIMSSSLHENEEWHVPMEWLKGSHWCN